MEEDPSSSSKQRALPASASSELTLRLEIRFQLPPPPALHRTSLLPSHILATVPPTGAPHRHALPRPRQGPLCSAHHASTPTAPLLLLQALTTADSELFLQDHTRGLFCSN